MKTNTTLRSHPIFRIERRCGLLLTIVTSLLLNAACVREGAPIETPSSLYQLVDALVKKPPNNHEIVEQASGTKLTVYNRNSAFVHFQGLGNLSSIGAYSIDVYELVVGGDATGSPHVLIWLNDFSCIRRSEIVAQYGAMDLIALPSAHATDGLDEYSMDEPWGKVIFGFRTLSSNCLKRITFAVKRL